MVVRGVVWWVQVRFGRRGLARLGEAWLGAVRLGTVRQAWLVWVCWVRIWCGAAGGACRGTVLRGCVWHGMAGMEMPK